MKKLLVIFALILGLSASSFATRPSFQLGVGGGGNVQIISLNLSVAKVGGYRVGWHAGLLGRVNIGRLYTQFNVDFIRQTNTIYLYDDIDDTNDDINLWGVNVPLTIGYKIVKTPLFKWRLYSGFGIGFLGKMNGTDDFGFERSDVISPHVTMIYGTGIDLAFVYLDFDYRLGLNKLYDIPARSQTHMFSLTMGILF